MTSPTPSQHYQPMTTHSPLPWGIYGPDAFGDYNILHPNEIAVIGAVVSNVRDPAEVAANAALIEEACNSYYSLKARIAELEDVLRQAKAAMLKIRTASIAGCDYGYGKPEIWADDLFRSHGDVTAAIKKIEGLVKP